jgi:hypothetical protein
MGAKPRVNVRSVPWLLCIDESIRRWRVRGRDNLRQAASDVLDGWATRAELDDLIRRRFLAVVPHDEITEIDRMREPLCGSTWTVDLTERGMRTFWPSRRSKTAPRGKEPGK